MQTSQVINTILFTCDVFLDLFYIIHIERLAILILLKVWQIIYGTSLIGKS